MNTFGGIPIWEFKLLILVGAFLLMFFVLVGAVAFWVYTLLCGRNKKDKERIERLKAKAPDDETAAKVLAKLERKRKRRRERNRASLVYEIVLFVLVACVAVASLVLFVIPGITDYVCKDYVVYTGSFEVRGTMRRSRIVLEDGTTLSGDAGFENGKAYGTVVYAKRTKLVLGGE
ncbi:MAG: hypothetical protein IJD82_04870 [Clostridia bacterium]|nr:hypothetical protein [Clostridia bacterium]